MKVAPYTPPPSSAAIIAQNETFKEHQLKLTQQKGGDQVAPQMGNKAADANAVKALEVNASLSKILEAQGSVKGGRPRKKRRFKTHKYIKRNYGRTKSFRIVRKHSRQTKK
jgi:hypothetical protein